MFTTRIIRNGKVLKALTKANIIRRNQMVQTATTELVFALVDLAKMIMKGDITLTPRQLSKVKQHKTNFQKLVNSKTGLKAKKNVMQTGGFLPALLGPIQRIGIPSLQVCGTTDKNSRLCH